MTSPEHAPDAELYSRYLAERDEILRHKWLESEKAGQDIGFEQALVDWVRHHREAWRKKEGDRGLGE